MLSGLSSIAVMWSFTLTVALPIPLRIQPGTAHPGDLVAFTARQGTQGQFAGKPLTFFPLGKAALAFVALSVDQAAGPLPFHLEEGPAPLSIEGTVDVSPSVFRERSLTVASKFIKQSAAVKRKVKADQNAFKAALAQLPIAPLFIRPFIWPRAPLITAPFGDLRKFNGKLQSQHYGTDLEGKIGDPIRASNDGRVVMVRDCYSSGNTVIIHHGAGLFTMYFHLSKAAVILGQTVRQGDPLGLVGKTGRVTGPHLHWAAKVNGFYVNPESLVRLNFDEVLEQ